MAAIIEGIKLFCEIFDGQGRLSLAARIITNLHIVPAFVDVEKLPHGHISFGILQNDLQAKLHGMLCLEWGRLHGPQMNKNARPYWGNLATSCHMCIYIYLFYGQFQTYFMEIRVLFLEIHNFSRPIYNPYSFYNHFSTSNIELVY